MPEYAYNKIKFIKKYVGNYTHDDFINVNEIIDGKSTIDLKIDTEGAEFIIIPALEISKFRCINSLILEVHTNIDFNGSFHTFDELILLLNKIETFMTCVHIHPNNSYGTSLYGKFNVPNLMEMTFINNNLIKNKHRIIENIFPIEFDTPSNPLAPEIGLDWIGADMTDL